MQTVLYALSFLVLFGRGVFYYGALGLATGIFGLIATRNPMAPSQKKYVTVYFVLNIFLLISELVITAVWLYLLVLYLTDGSARYHVAIFIIAPIAQIAMVIITIMAIRASKLLRAELDQDPPQYCAMA